MKKQLFYLLLATGVLSACGPAAPQLGKDSVEDVIGAMTLEVGSRCSRYYLSDTPFGNSCHCVG